MESASFGHLSVHALITIDTARLSGQQHGISGTWLALHAMRQYQDRQISSVPKALFEYSWLMHQQTQQLAQQRQTKNTEIEWKSIPTHLSAPTQCAHKAQATLDTT